MIALLVRLAEALRQHGIAVSTAELLDASQAVQVIDPLDRHQLRAALRCTLLKSPSDVHPFDVLFDSTFPAALSRHDREVETAVAQFAGLKGGERYFGDEYHADRVMRRLAIESGPATVRPGDVVSQEAQRLQLRAAIVDEVRDQVPIDQRLRHGRRAVEQLDFLRMTPADERALRHAAELLARRLAHRRKRRASRRTGALDVRSTLRRSLSMGGVPFDVAFRRPRRHAADIVVLADISGSVAGFSRFMLQLTNSLAQSASMAGSFRTFAFVDDIDDVTHCFRRGLDIRSAIAAVEERAGVHGNRGHSDYGTVFGAFERRYLRTIRPGSIVLVLGDARNNYHEVNVESLRRIRSRVRALHWLNPEDRTLWNTADSVLAAYEGSCDRVFECRNVEQLNDVIDQLF